MACENRKNVKKKGKKLRVSLSLFAEQFYAWSVNDIGLHGNNIARDREKDGKVTSNFTKIKK